MGVDPRRPLLLGFALVAVLCAALMTLSVGRGWSFDFLQPGKPIATTMGGHVERVPAPARDAAVPIEMGFPVELSTQPLASPPAAPAGSTNSEGGDSDDTTRSTSTDHAEARAGRSADRDAAQPPRGAGQAPATAARHAERAAARAEGDLEKAPSRG